MCWRGGSFGLPRLKIKRISASERVQYPVPNCFFFQARQVTYSRPQSANTVNAFANCGAVTQANTSASWPMSLRTEGPSAEICAFVIVMYLGDLPLPLLDLVANDQGASTIQTVFVIQRLALSTRSSSSLRPASRACCSANGVAGKTPLPQRHSTETALIVCLSKRINLSVMTPPN